MTDNEKRDDCGCELRTLKRTILPYLEPEHCQYPALLKERDELEKRGLELESLTMRQAHQLSALIKERDGLLARLAILEISRDGWMNTADANRAEIERLKGGK